MDPWLANIYGTGAADDLEKTAQVALLHKLAEEGTVDLEGLSDEQIGALAAQVFSGDEEEPEKTEASQEDVAQMQAAQQEQALAKEAQAKFEEADFLGRVMAHSYTQELEKIAADKAQKEKTAGRFSAAKDAIKAKAGPVASKAKDYIGKHRGKFGLGAGAAAGFAAGRAGKRKEASAFEKLADLRAQEILGAVGISPEQHAQFMAQMQAQQAQQAQPQFHPAQAAQPGQPNQQEFQGALDQRALELLAENGYDVDAIVEAVNGGQEQAQQ